MSYGAVLLNELLHLFLQVLSLFLGHSLEFLNNLALLAEVSMLLIAYSGIGCVTSLEEAVAGRQEIIPQLVTKLLRCRAYGLPLLLQSYELIGC